MSYKGFNSVELRKPTRSTFDLSHDKRLSLQMGELVPILCLECLPSDYFKGRSEFLMRVNPMLAPVFEQLQVYVHYFFVASRHLYDTWEKFITGGQFGPNLPESDPNWWGEPLVPKIAITDILGVDPTFFAEGSLMDYLGIPILADLPDAPHPVDWTGVTLDTMPFFGYQKIWFDYYRDRNFVSDEVFNIPGVTPEGLPAPGGTVNNSGTNILDFMDTYMTIRIRNYRHDYFHSALPKPQRGAEVMIPSVVNYLDTSLIRRTDTGLAPTDANLHTVGGVFVGSGTSVPVRVENMDSVGPLVEDFRTAYALQVWLERNNVGGSRYAESIQAHFAIRPQDARLQRAEYIGGGLVNIKISEVVSQAYATNESDATLPQGNLAGYGVAYNDSNRFEWFCPEHGFIYGLMSIISPPSYHQGLPKMFRRRSFLDYPWPTFAKLGEQEVKEWEIYASSFNQANDTLFGYQSQYADWKSKLNTSHGAFHSSLMHWTLTSDYGITPLLSEAFNQFDIGIEDRLFPVENTDNFLVYLHNSITAVRPLPYFGTPNTLGFQ